MLESCISPDDDDDETPNTRVSAGLTALYV
jgi:hypothetical protein